MPATALPCEQVMQLLDDCPAISFHVPAMHGMHSSTLMPRTSFHLPAMQGMQLLADACPASSFHVPATHAMHAPCPADSLYLPAAQLEHPPAYCPVAGPDVYVGFPVKPGAQFTSLLETRAIPVMSETL